MADYSRYLRNNEVQITIADASFHAMFKRQRRRCLRFPFRPRRGPRTDPGVTFRLSFV